MSACRPLVVRLLSAFKADNKRTSTGVGPSFLSARAGGGLSVMYRSFFLSLLQYYIGRCVIPAMTTIRRIAPYILMAAYMPLLVALSFHTHTEQHSEATECPDCAHHLHHKAHLAEAAVMAHDCVYCQLTSSSYYASQSVSLSTVQPLVTGVADVYDGRVAAVSYALPSLRAPPLQ